MSSITTDHPSDLTSAYLDWCRAEHQRPNTVKSRARALRLLDDAGTATREDIEAVWASRHDLSPATRSNDVAHWRAFYKWLERWEYRSDDPTKRIDAPHVPAGLPRPMSTHDLRLALDKFPPDLHRALAMGAYAGLRVSEAAAMDWAEIDIEANQLRVLEGKGGKARLIRISPILVDELLPMTGGNVVTAGHGENSAATLERRVNRALLRIGAHATFHQARHRFGTKAYQATMDLIAIGRMMGHESIATTAVYAAAADDVSAKIAAAVVR